MTPDPATLIGLLEVCHANGLRTFGLVKDADGVWWFPANEMTLSEMIRDWPEDLAVYLAAICFEVTKWLRDKHGLCLKREYGLWYLFDLDDRPVTFREVEYPDNEPAALLAACKEVGK